MVPNKPTKASRQERKKRSAKANLCNRVVANYRQQLADEPKSRLRSTRHAKRLRRELIANGRLAKALAN